MADDKFEASQRISNLLAGGQNAAARGEVEKLLAAFPGDPEVHTLAGDVYAWTGAPSTSYRQYNFAADAYNRLGQADKMLWVHHKTLELDPSLLDTATQTRMRLLALLVAAEDALLAGQNEKSVEAYLEAIRQFPNHTVTYSRLAALFVRMGRNSEAVAQYLTVARAFYNHGVTAKAAPYFERALELDPSHQEALESLLTCLVKDGKEAESEKTIKAALQRSLEMGLNDSAVSLFGRLPDATQLDVTPLRAALLLQSGDVEQAEAAASQLELDRTENQEWFKRMGRLAMERGDAAAGEAYFRWAAPEAVAAPAPVVLAPPPPPPPPPAPVFVAPAPPPPPAPVVVAAPVPPPPPPAPAPAPIVAVAPAPAPAMVPVAAPQPEEIPKDDDRVVMQTMGEMCLAEEMFEEAKQVFERLLRAEPSNKQFLDNLNIARSGLGLGAVTGPPPPMGAVPAPPKPAAMAPTPAPIVAPAPPPAPVVVAAPPPPVPVAAPAPPPAMVPVAAPAPPPAMVPVAAIAPPPPPPPPPPPVVMAPPPPPPQTAPMDPTPSRPVLEPAGSRKTMSIKSETHHMATPPVEWVATPTPPVLSLLQPALVGTGVPSFAFIKSSSAGDLTGSGAKITRAQHQVQLGELPPVTPSAVDYEDDIIE